MITATKPHISISQLNMYEFCGEQWRRRYIEKEIIPPGVALIVGKAVDDTVNQNMTLKMQMDKLFPLDNIKDLARDAANAEWDKGEVRLDDEQIKEGIKKVKGEVVDKTIRLAALHAESLAPKLKPTHVQRKIEIELTGYPVDLLGYIDIQEGTKSIRDTKTASKSPNQLLADTSDQLTVYAMAGKVIDGVIPEKLTLDYLVDNKTPKLSVIETHRTEEDFQSILYRIENMMEGIEKEVFIPCRQDHFLCSPKWCGFAPTCRYFRKSLIK